MTARSEWIEVPAQSKQIGPFRVVYLKPRKGSEGAHLVEFPDGRAVRVLPDGRNSGQKRSRTITEALTALSELEGAPIDPLTYLIGHLTATDLTWEALEPLREATVEEWLEAWLEVAGVDGRPDMVAREFLHDLEAFGWKIERVGK